MYKDIFVTWFYLVLYIICRRYTNTSPNIRILDRTFGKHLLKKITEKWRKLLHRPFNEFSFFEFLVRTHIFNSDCIICTLMKVSSVSERLEMEWFMFSEANTAKINIKVSFTKYRRTSIPMGMLTKVNWIEKKSSFETN